MIHDEKKIIKFILLVSVIALVASWLILSLLEAAPRKADFLENIAVEALDESEYVYSFSGVNVGNRLSSIDGWMVKRGQPTRGIYLDVRLAVRNKDTGAWLLLPTEINKRSKTTKELDDGTEYTWSKITARWLNVFLPAEGLQEQYDIYACYKINDDAQLVPIEFGK